MWTTKSEDLFVEEMMLLTLLVSAIGDFVDRERAVVLLIFSPALTLFKAIVRTGKHRVRTV